LVGLVLTATLTGCDVLQFLANDRVTTEATQTTFAHGSATIQVTTGDEATAVLDRIDDNTFHAVYNPEEPPAFPATAQAVWADGEGDWLLTVLASTDPNEAWSGQRATLSIQRYQGEPPLYADGSRCDITVTEISASGLAGRAECSGLRWLTDYDATTDPDGARPLPNLPPFNASIRFEARP
jgi:hypothetical protein